MQEHLDPAPAENSDPGKAGHKEGATLAAGGPANHDEDELEPTIVRGRE